MKSKDKTKQKKHESTIGKIIYGFLLFMPLLAIGVTCITCFWNKTITEDTQTAEIIYRYETNEVNTINDLQNGHIYKIDLQNTTYPTGNNITTLLTTKGIFTLNYKQSLDIDYLGSVSEIVEFKYNPTNNNFYFYSNSQNINLNSAQVSNIFYFVYGGYINTNYININQISQSDFLEISQVNITSTPTEYDVKNIFYYAVDKVEQSSLFNWAENSAIYTGMTATCNALDISTTFIPLLMTYWLVISVIYFLYDIILIILHVFHRKIHELEESI